MARPNWEYIRVDVLLPQHPKLDGLSSASKWTLIELWAHCGQMLTDGFVRDAAWKRIGSASTRRQIVAAGLASPARGGYMMHDYLEHQRSRAEVEELRRKRSESGRKGGLAKANAKQVPEQTPQQTLKQNSGKTVAEAEAEAEAEINPPVAEAVNSNLEVTQPPRAELPAGRWMAGNGTPLPPEQPDFETERRRQMDALMREYPEVNTQ